jgi:hypothetical protein
MPIFLNLELLPLAEAVMCALVVNICIGDVLLKQAAGRVMQCNTGAADRACGDN